MSSPTTTTSELLNMAFSGQENFIPAAEEARPHTFLSLAPTTSASYPVQAPKPAPKSPEEQSPTSTSTSTDTAPDAETLKTRRSSSLGSDASGKRRFLKLGPVHFGEGDGTGDWSEDVLAE